MDYRIAEMPIATSFFEFYGLNPTTDLIFVYSDFQNPDFF
jgi:hypothetical protein